MEQIGVLIKKRIAKLESEKITVEERLDYEACHELHNYYELNCNICLEELEQRANE